MYYTAKYFVIYINIYVCVYIFIQTFMCICMYHQKQWRSYRLAVHTDFPGAPEMKIKKNDDLYFCFSIFIPNFKSCIVKLGTNPGFSAL